jgi:hypothetical protein
MFARNTASTLTRRADGENNAHTKQMKTTLAKDWSLWEGTPTPGPFPLHIEKQGERLAVVTNQGNLFASTFDPMAARWIAALPELKQALEDFVLLADIEENGGPLANQARAALAKLKGGAL